MADDRQEHLPLPRLNGKAFNAFDYKVAEIYADHASLDDYIGRSGLDGFEIDKDEDSK